MGKRLLGKDSEGTSYYLADASWDCGWYWGYGYIQTRDSHQHADGKFYNEGNEYADTNIFTGGFLVEKTFSEKDGWKLRELMATFYQLKKQAELVGRGGMNVTKNPLSEYLKDKAEADRINKVVLPKVFEEINKILDKKEEI